MSPFRKKGKTVVTEENFYFKSVSRSIIINKFQTGLVPLKWGVGVYIIKVV